jgi:hypothetical protein
MERFTLFVGDREFELARLETLRELLQRKLISPSDRILFEGEDEPVHVSQALEDAGSEPQQALPTPPPSGSADDIWDAWSNTDSFPVDNLVSQMLGEVASVEAELAGAPGVLEPEPEPEPEPIWDVAGEIFEADERPSVEPEVLPDALIEDLPAESVDEVDSLRSWHPLTEDPTHKPPAREPAPTSRPRNPPTATVVASAADSDAATRPSTFVEFVQQRKAAGMDLEIKGDEQATLPPGLRDRRFSLWPVALVVLAILVLCAVYGTVRTGANRQYPTESEIRARYGGGDVEPVTAEAVQPTEAPADDDATEVRVDDGRRERILRSSIPVALQRFKNVEEFEDVLFMDIANAGVRVRELHVEALVVAPLPDSHRQRPEEVNITLRLDSLDGTDGEDILAKAALVIGHYGADAHVRLRRVVLHVVLDSDVSIVYELQGDVAQAFYEREVDLGAFLLALQQVEGNEYRVEEGP